MFTLGAFTTMSVSQAGALRTFPDLEKNSYYESAVQSMAGAGFVTGYADGTFKPNDPVTRGQVAVMMNRMWTELVRQGVVDGTGESTSSRTSRSANSSSSSTSSSSSSSSSSLATTGNYFRFSVDKLSPLESTPKVSISVSRIGGTSGDVSVGYETVAGTATVSEDFSSTTGTLEFKNGETSKTITITLKEDTKDEQNETFTLKLKSPSSGMGIGAPAEAVITILDNDEGGGNDDNSTAGEQGKISFSALGYAVSENAGSVTIRAVRTSGTKGQVTVEYLAKPDTATKDDFTETSGTLTFAEGEAEKSFTVNITNNTNTNGYKIVKLYLKNPAGGVVLGTKEVNLTILDDEITTPSNGKIGFDDNEVEVDEDEGVFYATVKRISGATGTVSVSYATKDGSALTGNDYTHVTGTITFLEGESLKVIPITLVSDNVYESSEEFSLHLTNPTGGATLLDPYDQYITIE